MVSAPSLTDTQDVEKLIPGNLSVISNTALAIADAASDFVSIAAMLDQVEVKGWKGTAADQFKKKWHDIPESWGRASQAYTGAHGALVDYKEAFTVARSQAEDAVRMWLKGQELTEAARAEYVADKAAKAKEQEGKAYTPGPKSAALGQDFHDPGAKLRREAQQDLDDARTRLRGKATTAAETLGTWAQKAPTTPPSGWDQFWGGVNDVLEFPGNVVEGFLLSGWDTIVSSWNMSPAKWVLELIFTGPDATWKDAMNQGKQTAEAIDAITKDPWGAAGKLVGDVLDLKEWGTNPGHVIGNALFLLVTLGGAGAAAKAGKVSSDAEKLLTDGGKLGKADDLKGVNRGDDRDAGGKFTGKNGTNNYGKNAEAQGLSRYEKMTGLTPDPKQVKASVPGLDNGRFFDGLAKLPDGTYEAVEVKSGSATRTAAQRAFDDRVNSGTPATATLNGHKITITSVKLIEVDKE